MRAVRVVNGTPTVTEVPEPAGEGVRVDIRAAGICGSDVHVVSAGYPIQCTLGHELAGTLSDGTPVAIEPLAPCRICEPCGRGDYQLCDLGFTMIIGMARDGGMADRVLVPPSAIVPLPRGVDVRDASLVEPLAVNVHGLRRAGVHGGQSVAVVGGGTIGLCAVAAAKAADTKVALDARHDHQRAAGERLGAGPASGTYDIVIEAAGTKSALERAVQLARPGAKVVCVASYWEGMELPGFSVCLKEIDIIPASMYGRVGASRDIDVAASLLGDNPEIPRAIITHRFPLDAATEAFRVAADRSSGAIKVVLEP